MIKLSIVTPVWNQEELVIRELDNLPRRDDVEVLVRDDGSTDNTLANLYKYKEEHPELNLTIFANGENKGVAWTKNRLLESAQGEYIHIHDSDDYVYRDQYNYIIDCCLDGSDIVCFDLKVNDGYTLPINENTERGYCAQIARFIRREFIGDLRFPEEIRAGDDWYFAEAMLAKNPKRRFTGILAYHYNFPREGSLFDLQRRGLIASIKELQ